MKRPPPLTPEEIQARVLHRDGLILVIDKPAGLAVHAGPSKAPNLEECFDALRFGLLAYTVQGRDVNLDIARVVGIGPLIAAFTWGEVPAQSIAMASPAMVSVARKRISTGSSPRPSTKSSKVQVPSGSAAISARIRRSA